MKKLFISLILLIVATCTAFAEYQIISTNEGEGYKSLVINYTSVAADCVTPVTVSGVITIPTENLTGTAVWVIDNHHTLTDNASVPSVVGTTAAGLAGFSKNFVMIAADYLGYGVSAKERHPFLCHRQNALNSIDLLKVALELLPNYGIQPMVLFNMGYSQGGGVAMAVHRELESMMMTDPVIGGLLSSVKGFASWCGDGAYNPVTSVDFYYEKADKVSFPALIPLTINGFLASAPEELRKDYTFNNFFQSKLLTPAELLNPMTGATINYPGLEALIASKLFDNDTSSMIMVLAAGMHQDLASIFSDIMFDHESQIVKDLYSWLELNNQLDNWTPVFPISLYHLEEDDIVTSRNTQLAASKLNIPENRVHIISNQLPGMEVYNNHSKFGPFFFSNVATEIAAILNATSIESVEAEQNFGSKKILEDGKLKILIGGVNYDVMGRRL